MNRADDVRAERLLEVGEPEPAPADWHEFVVAGINAVDLPPSPRVRMLDIDNDDVTYAVVDGGGPCGSSDRDCLGLVVAAREGQGATGFYRTLEVLDAGDQWGCPIELLRRVALADGHEELFLRQHCDGLDGYAITEGNLERSRHPTRIVHIVRSGPLSFPSAPSARSG
jgi:hypothetical protein